MKLSLTARLFLADVSGSTKATIMQMYKAKPTFPKDEAQIDAVLAALDSTLPPGLPSNRQKVYLKYLAKQLWGITPPGFVLKMAPDGQIDFEDKPRVSSTLANFEQAIKDQTLTGEATNVEAYATLSDMQEAAATEKGQKVKAKFTIDNLPEEAESSKGGQPGNPRQAVAEGSKVIAQDGSWKCYKIKAGDPKGKEAGSWLGMNGWWGVSWCVGRDYSSEAWKSRPYMNEGDFYFLVRDGISRYAIATDGSKADVYNPADDVIWQTGGASGGNFPSLEATAKQLGAEFNASSVSSLPQEALGILRAATAADPYLAGLIPPDQLNETDTASLDKIIASCPAEGLVKDLNSNSGYRGKGVTAGIVNRCVAKNNKNGAKDFSAVWDQFGEQAIIMYIEALATNGYKELPPSLEAYFVKEAENFEF